MSFSYRDDRIDRRRLWQTVYRPFSFFQRRTATRQEKKKKTKKEHWRQRDMFEAAVRGPSLGDMPAEIVDLIVAHLFYVCDAANCYIALGQWPAYVLVKRALAMPEPSLCRGAPLAIAQALADGRASPAPFSWVDAAALGGRRDVVAWLHGVADVDRLDGVDATAWADTPRRRRRRVLAQARCLMETAAGGGHVDVLEWLLDFYAAPRFASKPLFNQGMLSHLYERALGSRDRAVEVLTALHRYIPRGQCACPRRLAHVALQADRADVLAWMCDWNCAARLDPNDPRKAAAMGDMAADARAASVILWVGARADRRRIVERIIHNAVALGTPQACPDSADLIIRAGLVWPSVALSCSALCTSALDAVGRAVDWIATYSLTLSAFAVAYAASLAAVWLVFGDRVTLAGALFFLWLHFICFLLK